MSLAKIKVGDWVTIDKGGPVADITAIVTHCTPKTITAGSQTHKRIDGKPMRGRYWSGTMRAATEVEADASKRRRDEKLAEAKLRAAKVRSQEEWPTANIASEVLSIADRESHRFYLLSPKTLALLRAELVTVKVDGTPWAKDWKPPTESPEE